MRRQFTIHENGKETVCAIITIDVRDGIQITGAEEDLVILDLQLKPAAVIQLQPGFDRKEERLP